MTKEEETTQDLKQETETQEEESASEETTQDKEESTESTVSEDVENTEDDKSSSEIADELLADGTPKSKEIKVKHEKYNELSEKSKLFDSFKPLLERLKDEPELFNKVRDPEHDGEPLEVRLRRLEKEHTDKRRQETKTVITEAIDLWGKNFRSSWKDVQPIVNSLEKAGVPYRDALQRAYFSVNPDAIQEEARLVKRAEAQQAINKRGKMSSGSGSASKIVHETVDDVDLPPADVEYAKANGIPLDLYKKHFGNVKHLY